MLSGNMIEDSGGMSTKLLQPFANPTALPLYSVQAMVDATVTSAPIPRMLIVAPHPDDECLGCGGAIALLQAAGCAIQVLVVSNGTMSHPNSRKFPASVLQALRESETRAAMALLGLPAESVIFLQLQDGAVPNSESSLFTSAMSQCRSVLQRWLPDLIFLPWRFDPHADHRASWQLVDAALRSLQLTPRRLEYPIWDWDLAQRGQISDNISAWRLDISAVVTQKQQAIAAYRSQVSDLIDDDPTGFRLSPELLTYFTQPWEIYFEERLCSPA